MIRTVPAVAALIATAAVVLVATPALADVADDQSIIVPTADLDLSSPAHRARLKARVGRAADRVCGRNDTRGVSAHRAFRICHDSAMRGALGE